MTRFVAISADTSRDRVLALAIPDAIFVVPYDMTGQEFLHLPRVLTFDREHDWTVRGGRIHLSPAIRDHHWLVFRYGPEPRCPCGQTLLQGSRFCCACGAPTSSTVERAE